MKKLIVVVLAIAMLGFFGVAQAASDMPDILGSIETSNYQTMSDEEMDQVVGELFISVGWGSGSFTFDNMDHPVGIEILIEFSSFSLNILI